MSRFFRTSQTPIVDYGEQYPIEAIAMGLAGRQQSYNINKAEWEAKLQAIEDTPYLKLGLGDEQAHEELMNKYQKLIDESSSNSDFSQMGSQLEFIKREIKKDFGINGVASALKNRYTEGATFSEDFKKRVEGSELYAEDQGMFTSQFKKFYNDNGEINSLGVPTIENRPDYQKKISDWMKSTLKDRTDVELYKTPDGKYWITNKYTGVREQDLTNSLNSFLETIPGHQQWRKRDMGEYYKSLYNEDGTINSSSPLYTKAADEMAALELDLISNIEKSNAVINDKKSTPQMIGEEQRNLKAYQAQLEDLRSGNKESKILNSADQMIRSSYNQKFIDPYMARANYGLSNQEIKADDYYKLNYEHSLRLKEIDDKNKTELNRILPKPGMITPVSQSDIEETAIKIQQNKKEVEGRYNNDNLKIFQELSKVNPKLQEVLAEYNSTTDYRRRQELQSQINNSVHGWMNDYINNPDNLGSYKQIIADNYSGYRETNNAYLESLKDLKRVQSATETQAQIMLTPDLDKSLGAFKAFLLENKATLPPELKQALEYKDNTKLLSLFMSGKVSKANYDKLGIQRFEDAGSIGAGVNYDANKVMYDSFVKSINSKYSTSSKNAKEGDYKSTNNFDFYGSDKSYVKQMNDDMSFAVSDGFAGMVTDSGELVDEIVNKNVKGAVTNREMVLSNAVSPVSGKPLLTATVTYKTEGGSNTFQTYVEMPDKWMDLYLGTFKQMAAEEGAIGSLGGVALGRGVLNNFNDGEFLRNVETGEPSSYSDKNGNLWVLAPVPDALGVKYELYKQTPGGNPEQVLNGQYPYYSKLEDLLYQIGQNARN